MLRCRPPTAREPLVRFFPDCAARLGRVELPGSYSSDMELTGLGGGIMLAIAAVLWLVYLLPTWLRRREYLATERNAVRLQQTIRVLAETAEIPAPVRADLRAKRMPQGPVAVGRPVTRPDPRPHVGIVTARRLRRTRAVAGLVLLVSVAVTAVQVVLAVAGAASWLLLAGGALSAVCSFALLGRLADVARSKRAPAVRQTRRSAPLVDHEFEAQQQAAEWTPVAMPKPLYLSRTVIESVEVADPTAALEAAAAQAEEALRSAPQPPSIPSRFAAMGRVDAAGTALPDLDAALARRRAAAAG